MNCQNCDAPVRATDEWCEKCGAKLLRQRVFLGVPKPEEFALAAEESDSATEQEAAEQIEERDARPHPAAAPSTTAASSIQPIWGGFFRRAAAFLIDVAMIVLLSAVMGLMSYIGYKVGLAAHNRAVNWNTVTPLFSLLTLAGLALTTAYFVVFHGLEGRTIGKWLLGLRLVGEDHGGVSFRRALLRWIGTVGLGGASLGLAFLWILWQREKRGWHDLIARTWVIRE